MPDPRLHNSLPFVVTYVFCDKPLEFVQFMKDAFLAEESRERAFSDGKLQNAMLQIGESYFEISQARGQFQQVTLSFHLYVDNVDKSHLSTVKVGCEEKSKPQDMDYGDRESWVVDPFGNNWFLATYKGE